jgi:hypothetical protein
MSAYFIFKITWQIYIKFNIGEIALKFLGEIRFSPYETSKINSLYDAQIETAHPSVQYKR